MNEKSEEYYFEYCYIYKRILFTGKLYVTVLSFYNKNSSKALLQMNSILLTFILKYRLNVRRFLFYSDFFNAFQSLINKRKTHYLYH